MFVEPVTASKSMVTISHPSSEHPVAPQILRAVLQDGLLTLEGRKFKVPIKKIESIKEFGRSVLSDKAMVPQHILGSRLKLAHATHPNIKIYDLNFQSEATGNANQPQVSQEEPVFEALDSFPFDERLQNVLQAADEDGRGVLSHKEISELLRACIGDQGLTFMDTQSVLASVVEDAQGFVDINKFLDVALTSVDYLRSLRSRIIDEEAAERLDVRLNDRQAAIDLCFSKELENTATHIIKIVTNTNKPKDEPVLVTSHAFRAALQARSYRLTEHEVSLLVQYLEESDEGILNLGYPQKIPEDGVAHRPFELQAKLLSMRRDLVYDALPAKTLEHVVRAVADAIKAHRELFFSEHGLLKASATLPLLLARKILSSLDQIYLPRIAIHVLLQALPGEGAVQVKDLIKYTTSFVLYFFNEGRQFEATHEQVAAHLAEIKAQAELNELNRFMGKATEAVGPAEDKKNSQAEMDACEKSMISYLSQTLWSEHGKGSVPVNVAIASLSTAPLTHTLTQYELNSMVAEIDQNPEGLTTVPPAEHLRRWLPIIWEIRRSEYYSRLSPDNFTNAVNMVAVELDRLGIEEEDPNAVNRHKLQASRTRLLTQATRDGHRSQTQPIRGRNPTVKRTEKSDRETEKDVMPVITDPEELQLFNIAQARRKAYIPI